MQFAKTAKTISEQITLLKSRGLKIENEHQAEFHLNNISYYRLSAYFLSFQKYRDPQHTFMPWATFNKVIGLYVFDRELRSILLDAIERIEVALRCRIVYEYCGTYGNNWYENPVLFHRKHNEFMGIIKRDLSATKEVFITHYFQKYSQPANPPGWMTMEILSFGALSTMFKNLKTNSAKKNVSTYFGVSNTVLESWLEHLVYIRNVCAHHGRLWNRTLTVKATIPTIPMYRWINVLPSNPDKIYTTLCITAYLLQRVTKQSPFHGKIAVLLARYNSIDLHAAGFPASWKNDIFWDKIPIAWTHRFRMVLFNTRNKLRNANLIK